MESDCGGEEFIGYNEWATESLHVHIATDFVYETEDDPSATNRGVFIAEDVIPHTEVFRIPLDSVLSVKSLHNIPALQSLAFFQQRTPEHEDDQLALALLYEKYIQCGQSKWAKHIELLPRTYYNALYFEPEVLQALKGSNLYYMALHLKDHVAAEYARLKQSVLIELFEKCGEEINVDLFHEYFSLENYKWALSTIWSRFVTLRLTNVLQFNIGEVISNRNKNQSIKAMVPVFDMLNHDPEAEMTHFFDRDSQEFKLVSRQHWHAGTQLFINYGPLSNHKLLSLYGFVILSNPFDTVEIWLPMNAASTKFFEVKQKLFFVNDMDHETYAYELVADEFNYSLLCAARIQEIDCETLKEFKSLAHKAIQGEKLSLKNEQEALTRLIYTFESLLKAYPTEIEEDDAFLKSWDEQEEDCRQHHVYMATVVRRSDKFILLENIRMLKWRLLEILQPNQSPSDDLNASSSNH
ncbi:hypothetical protein CCR75_007699 [Bremia lactucae]|uniref:Rubisco LSMT substrate-binding domain-containing protein n=1 Tax=Bremia lactucae TaxID=4779 RepID=A0A976IE52_BRELC|nr:hypothetical protein CCR75_007699 [Bremia lactucae]